MNIWYQYSKLNPDKAEWKKEEVERLRKEAILKGTQIDKPASPSETPRPGITTPIAAPAASGGKYVPPNRQPGKKGPPPTAASGEEDVPLWRRKLPSTPAESEIRWDKHKKKDPPEKW
ncbi:hypothetical protein Tco_1472323 [Tanacetum coccineum]